MHRHTAPGQWAVDLLQRNAILPGGTGQCNSCNALSHRLGAAGSGTLAIRDPTKWEEGESYPGGGHYLKSGSGAMHWRSARGQWVVQLLQYTASLPRGSGQWNSYQALPHFPGAVGSGTPAIHCLIA